jgi:hypothetical protein
MFMDRIADLTWMASTRETEERYVDTVGTLLSQLNFCDPHIRRSRLGPKLRQGFPTFSDLEQRMTIEVKLLSFEPGDGIEAHDHPDMTGVMACVSGRVSVDNYERVLNEESSGCLLKQVARTPLHSRQCSTLTRLRANIHQLYTDDGCELIDIFTPPYTGKRITSTRWYQISKEPSDQSQALYRAKVMTRM